MYIVQNKRFTIEIGSGIALLTTRAKGLSWLLASKVLRIVENERFTVDIDSENAILDCTLER